MLLLMVSDNDGKSLLPLGDDKFSIIIRFIAYHRLLLYIALILHTHFETTLTLNSIKN